MRKIFGKACAGALAAALCVCALPATAFAYSDEVGQSSSTAEITAADVVAAAVEGSGATSTTSESTNAASESSTSGAGTTSSGIGGTNTLTPDGTGTVVDAATDEDGKLFYTITTEAGNVFYLVIDEQRTGENVYFLNAVTENDLLALAASTETGGASGIGGLDTAEPAEVPPVEDTTPAPEDEPGTDEPEAASGGMGPGALLLVLVLAAAAGGAGWYFKVYKPKQQMLENAEDLEDFELEDEYSMEDPADLLDDLGEDGELDTDDLDGEE